MLRFRAVCDVPELGIVAGSFVGVDGATVLVARELPPNFGVIAGALADGRLDPIDITPSSAMLAVRSFVSPPPPARVLDLVSRLPASG